MRDRRGRSPAPRPIGSAVGSFRDSIAPVTPLAAIQTVWSRAMGTQLAAVTRPVAERDGVLTVECESAVWAQELALMETSLKAKLDQELDGKGPEKLRFRAG